MLVLCPREVSVWTVWLWKGTASRCACRACSSLLDGDPWWKLEGQNQEDGEQAIKAMDSVPMQGEMVEALRGLGRGK